MPCGAASLPERGGARARRGVIGWCRNGSGRLRRHRLLPRPRAPAGLPGLRAARGRRLRYEVIVVENASGDGSAAIVRDEFPEVRLIALEQNIGFAAGLEPRRARGHGRVRPAAEPRHRARRRHVRGAAALRPRAPARRSRRRAHADAAGELDPGSCWGAQSLWSLVCFASGLSTLLKGSRVFNPESLGGWRRDTAARGRHRHRLPVPRAARGLGRARRLRRDVLHVRRGRRPGGARAQARLPPGDHAGRRDRPPRRAVVALGREARDDAALPRRARAQALHAAPGRTSRSPSCRPAPACARWARASRAARARPGPPPGGAAATGASGYA